MILRLLGMYLLAEGLGSLIYFRNGKTMKNYVFQIGRTLRIIIGVLLLLGAL